MVMPMTMTKTIAMTMTMTMLTTTTTTTTRRRRRTTTTMGSRSLATRMTTSESRGQLTRGTYLCRRRPDGTLDGG